MKSRTAAFVLRGLAFTNMPESAIPSASVFIATSRDGFIADTNGSVSWLNDLQTTHPLPDGDDGGFGAFLSSVDAIVMGRTTYDTVLGFLDSGIEWPYGSIPVFVYTSNVKNVKVPDELSKQVKAATGTPKEVLQVVASEIDGAKDIYVDGGRTIRSFLDEGLVRRATVTVVPVSLGDGVPLLLEKHKDVLQEASREKMPNGFVKMTYEMK
jgi:dihydrofolate reductase